MTTTNSQTDRKRTASSSSTARALSKDWGDAEAFADAILASLGGDAAAGSEPDLLTRWICQELADRLKAADKARTKAAQSRAKQDAIDLILRLWEHRSHWPNGWPPAGARALFDQLAERPRFVPHPDSEPTGVPWFDDIVAFLDLGARESRLWLWLGMLELDSAHAQELLDSAPAPDAEADEEDRETLKRFAETHAAATEWAKSTGAPSKKQIKEAARKEFGRIRTERNRLIREALA